MLTYFSSIFCIINIYFLELVSSADYCEFGTCNEEDHYCCGDNLCCKKTIEIWYFWATILLVFIAVFVALCLYIGRKRRNKYRDYDLVKEKEPVLS